MLDVPMFLAPGGLFLVTLLFLIYIIRGTRRMD